METPLSLLAKIYSYSESRVEHANKKKINSQETDGIRVKNKRIRAKNTTKRDRIKPKTNSANGKFDRTKPKYFIPLTGRD